MKMVVGRKKRGKLRKRWEDGTKEDMKELGLVKENAMDRTRWKQRILPAVTTTENGKAGRRST